jgi:hypothetical protein
MPVLEYEMARAAYTAHVDLSGTYAAVSVTADLDGRVAMEPAETAILSVSTGAVCAGAEQAMSDRGWISTGQPWRGYPDTGFHAPVRPAKYDGERATHDH